MRPKKYLLVNMEKKRAKTVRLDAQDWEAVNSMKEE
jgi:hypothetical protein